MNKQDPDELSYALNSMFYWYQQAVKCYVYMNDASTSEDDVHSMEFERSDVVQTLLDTTRVISVSFCCVLPQIRKTHRGQNISCTEDPPDYQNSYKSADGQDSLQHVQCRGEAQLDKEPSNNAT